MSDDRRPADPLIRVLVDAAREVAARRRAEGHDTATSAEDGPTVPAEASEAASDRVHGSEGQSERGS